MATTNSILAQGFADVLNTLSEAAARAPLSMYVPGVPQHGTFGHHALRPKTAAEKGREHLGEVPEDAALSVRDLAARLGVGKSTVSRVMQSLRDEELCSA